MGLRSTDPYLFLEVRTISRNRVCQLSGTWYRSVECERKVQVSEKDEDGKRLKIILPFTRRYLDNRKSYGDNSKSTLKGKNVLFQRSFAQRPISIILGLVAVQTFVSFNKI